MRATRALAFAAALVGLGAAAGCGGGTPASSKTTTTTAKHAATTTTVPAGPPLSLSEISTQYAQASAPANAAFRAFLAQIALEAGNNNLPASASPTDAKKARAAAVALQRAATRIYAISDRSPAKVKTALRSLLSAENVVYQGLLDLANDYDSRSFDLIGWGSSFSTAAEQADGAAATVAHDLGLPEASGSTGPG